MDYHDWIQKTLPGMMVSGGLRMTPGTEIATRVKKLQSAMPGLEMEGALVIHKMDRFYLSGTAQDGFLYIPCQGEPLLLVKREWHRATMESGIQRILPMTSLKEIPSFIREHTGKLPAALGLELDMLPVKDYFRLQELFPFTRFLDVSTAIRQIRKIKGPFEIACMREASRIGKMVYEEGLTLLREGMSEIAFSGLLEAAAKRHGHEGLLRVRSLNYEAYSWHILSGPTGSIVSQSDSPMGGLGLSPAFPVGAGRRLMQAHEPIVVDFGICWHGYQADQTRMFSIGKMPQKFRDAWKACQEIHDALLEKTRPGADCGELYRDTLVLARRLGYGDSYLGPSGLQTRFVGHGIGLELNEYPFLAEGHHYPLEAGMTFAVEPKMVFTEEGSVGAENTILVTENGCEILTPIENRIFEICHENKVLNHESHE